MILPLTYTEAIVCLALSMLFWGSWPNLLRLTGKWRYELFYWDFSFGVVLVAVLAAFTLGSLNSKELTFQDNLLISSYHKVGYGLAAGIVLNLANLLFVAALSVAPLSVVFPVAMGVGLVVAVGSTLSALQGGLLLPLGGATVMLAAVVANAFTYSTYAQEQQLQQKPPVPDPRSTRGKQLAPAAAGSALPAKGVVLSVMSGVAMGLASPLVNLSRTGEDGLGAYTAALMVGIATLVSTLVFSPFFTVFAVQGKPVNVRAYFNGSRKQHVLGMAAGGLWVSGLIASFASGGTLATVQAGSVATQGFAEGSVILGSLCGWLGWREFKDSSYRVRLLLTAMLVLWVMGAAMMILNSEPAK